MRCRFELVLPGLLWAAGSAQGLQAHLVGRHRGIVDRGDFVTGAVSCARLTDEHLTCTECTAAA
jgi:hypothetical protein